MATQLFKDGESIWIEPKAIARHIEAGWSPVDPEAPIPALDISSPKNHVGHLAIPPGASEEESEHHALKAMGIVSDEIEIGATNLTV